jgi:hypothetical protein
MKLTKNKLIKLTKSGLEKLGYREFKDTITPAQGLYGKLLPSGLYLTLGLTISRYYDNLFTASFYLSKTTNWATFGQDIPNDSYKRMGFFLTGEERKVLLHREYSHQDSGDAWWNIEDENVINDFLKTVEVTESRFLNQHGLVEKIANSIFINELWKLAKRTIEKISDKIYIGEYNYKFIPPKNIDNIPIEWFKVAEKVITEEDAILNVNTVKRLAADAYRQQLLQSSR